MFRYDDSSLLCSLELVCLEFIAQAFCVAGKTILTVTRCGLHLLVLLASSWASWTWNVMIVLTHTEPVLFFEVFHLFLVPLLEHDPEVCSACDIAGGQLRLHACHLVGVLLSQPLC